MILLIAGSWKLLEKSGLKGWWALIPGAREYQLSRCAGREPEGRIWSVITMLKWVVNLIAETPPILRILNASAATLIFLAVIVVPLTLISLVYALRVFAGLTEVYGVRKRWLLLWFLFAGITAVIWGFHRDFQPAWKVAELNAALAELAAVGDVSVMDDGLTVNLQERSTTEFFQKKMLLRDIHMHIPQGHMVLLLGGSGAGKTTYLNAVNGFEKANAEVMLNSRNMYKKYKKMIYEVGFVPQTEMIRSKDTVLNTLLDTAKLRLPMNLSRSQRRARVDEVMDVFGLKPVQNSLVEKLSGGQKKRLSIAMEFISNPALFILDEPDSGLDGVMARELFTQLRKIADTGRIVIAITHTPDRVIDLFDDVIVLAKDSAGTGRLAFYGSIEEAKNYFGRDSMEEIVKCVNTVEEGGDGRADEFVLKYVALQNQAGTDAEDCAEPTNEAGTDAAEISGQGGETRAAAPEDREVRS
ncbi:MAG: ABC transporter ATP-binding protein [Eubacterium sp.]|nr:ABC transporter ATP-binding protein [Eubacterium sp.]